MKTIKVDLGDRSYNIVIQRGIANAIGETVKNIFDGNRIAVITDANVNGLYGVTIINSLKNSGYNAERILLEPGEETKSFSTLVYIIKKLVGLGITRSDAVIALGGGVVGDIAGFAASIYLRGIRYIHVPTTLMAQVDSAIGGKTAIDLPEGKNLVGSIHQPTAVVTDPDLLATLPEKYIKDGISEIIKYGCIHDASLFEALENHHFQMDELVEKCCQIKKSYVERDEFDTGERMKLNFGHTLGHAIEKAGNYSEFTHGEAVAIGMHAITEISERKGLTQTGTAQRIKALLTKYGLPYKMPYPLTQLLPAMAHDKKNFAKSLNLVLLKKIGESFIYPAQDDFFNEVSI